MLCAFDGPPKIVRFHGRGRVRWPGDAEFELLATTWGTTRLGARSIVLVDVARVSTSCGFGVPRMDYVNDRDEMATWCAKKGEDGVRLYVRQKNATSLDGLPGTDTK